MRDGGGRLEGEALHLPVQVQRRDVQRVHVEPGAQFNSFVEISTDFSTGISTEFL